MGLLNTVVEKVCAKKTDPSMVAPDPNFKGVSAPEPPVLANP
jgi:hypothetical protein